MTHAMVKGSNIPLSASAVRAVLRWSPAPGIPDIDVSALLLGPGGRVRSDEDFVFYNQPRHPSGLVRHRTKQRDNEGITDRMEVDLDGLGPSVDCVVIAASVDSGTFRQVGDLRILVYDMAADAGTEAIAEYHVVPETGDETALNCGEFYRRGDTWKFRAVGQGYTTGLGALATEFGITVEDENGGAQAAQDGPPGQDDPSRQQPDAGGTGEAGQPPAAAVDPSASASSPDHASAPAPDSPATQTPPPPPGTALAAPQPVPAAAAPGVPPGAPPPPPQPPTAPPPPPRLPQQGGYGYPPSQPGPQGGGYGYPPPQPAPQSGGYGYPPPQGGYGYPQQTAPQASHAGYGYPQQTGRPGHPGPHSQQPHPSAPYGPPAGRQIADGAQQGSENFVLPPQGPQFQPDRSGGR